MYEDDGYDGVQYDTFYAPDPAQLEAEAIRRECIEQDARAAERRHTDHVLIVKPY